MVVSSSTAHRFVQRRYYPPTIARKEYFVLGPTQRIFDLFVILDLLPNWSGMIASCLVFHAHGQDRARQGVVGRSHPQEREHLPPLDGDVRGEVQILVPHVQVGYVELFQ